MYIQGVPKKRGISEDNSVCFTAQLMLNLGFSFSLHLKIEIHMFVPSTQAFLSDIREPRNKFFKNPIWHQLLGTSNSSFITSIKTIIHRLTSEQSTTEYMLSEQVRQSLINENIKFRYITIENLVNCINGHKKNKIFSVLHDDL